METLTTILALSRDAIVICDQDGAVRKWSPSAQQIYGWDEGEANGKPIDQLLATRSTSGAGMVDPAYKGTVVRRRRDGSAIRLELRRAKCRDETAVGELFIDLAQPCHDQSQHGHSAEGPADRSSRLLDEIATALVRIDLTAVLAVLSANFLHDEGALRVAARQDPALARDLLRLARISGCNVAARDLLFRGGTPQDAVLADIWATGTPDAYLAILGAFLSGVGRFSTPLTLLDGNARSIECEAIVHLSPEVAGERAIVLSLNDISAFRDAIAESEQSRQYYKVIFENMPIALYRLDGRGGAGLVSELLSIPDDERDAHLLAHPALVRKMADSALVAEVNHKGAELMRAAKGDVVGRSLLGFWERRIDTYRRALGARLRNELYEERTQIVATDGQVMEVLFAMAPVAHFGERFTIVGMVDLSELRDAEEDLSRLQAGFAHAARVASLGEMTASLAHEVSQPLSAIHLCAETALRWLNRPEPNLDEARTQLSRVTDHAGRATSVVKRVRETTRVTGSRRQAADLAEIVAGALALVAPQARAARAEISFEPEGGRFPVLADQLEIEQVIVNLLVNALQAMDEAESTRREITVALDRRDEVVECAIFDTGPGIAGADIDRIFERFFTTKREGMGLGLAICRTIAEAHDGSIAIVNRSDRSGARSSIVLPRSPSQPT